MKISTASMLFCDDGQRAELPACFLRTCWATAVEFERSIPAEEETFRPGSAGASGVGLKLVGKTD